MSKDASLRNTYVRTNPYKFNSMASYSSTLVIKLLKVHSTVYKVEILIVMLYVGQSSFKLLYLHGTHTFKTEDSCLNTFYCELIG